MKKKILYNSLIGLSLVGVSSSIFYGFYYFSKEQSKNVFVKPDYTKMSDLFNKDGKTIIKEKYIAGEKGLVVSKGPIRISSAYNSLLEKEQLVKLANWLSENVSWGGNAVSLKNITFTTGIDKGQNGTTKGFHTAGRDGSSIFISPDAFEEIGKYGSELFKTYQKPCLDEYISKFTNNVHNIFLNNKVNFDIPDWLNEGLTKDFNGTTTSVGTGKYNKTSTQKTESTYSEILKNMWYDNLLKTKLENTQLEIQSRTTKYGDMIFTSTERLAYLIKNNKMNEAVEKHKDKLAFDTALKLFWNSTGSSKSLGNTYLQLALREIIFKDDYVDSSNKTISYTSRPRDEWDKVAGISKNSNITDTLYLKNGYFKSTLEGGITSRTVLNRVRLYQLFLTYYDQVKTFLDSQESLMNILKNMWNDKKMLAANSWINLVQRFSATDRVRWLLSGAFPKQVSFNVKRSDEWMLNNEEKKFIDKQKNILDRKIGINIDEIYKEIVKTKIKKLNNESISNFYKEKLIDSMKYTISHEYGHHETMWANYGVYGKRKKDSMNVYNNTIGIYSESKSASGLDYINERSFDILREYAKHDKGIDNALSIIMASGDKYSTTWTPTYSSHQYLGFKPNNNNNKDKWSHATDDLFQIQLIFGNDSKTGAPKVSLAPNEIKGKTPIQFNTIGVDSKGTSIRQNNYLISFDRSLLSNSNSVKKISKNKIGQFLRFIATPDDLLYGYQLTKWILDGRSAENKSNKIWQANNSISLPKITKLGLRKPTVQFTPILTLDPSDRISKMFTFEGVLRLAFGLKTKDSKELIEAIDKVVSPLYDELIKKYPNLFEEKNGKPRLTDYERGKAIYNYIVNETKNKLKNISKEEEYNNLVSNFGIYYDPKAFSYLKASPDSSRDILFDKYNDDTLVTDGSYQLSTSLNAFADYSGNYPEFMTRVINQLEFRPNYDSFKINGVLDTAKLVKYNEGWYDDLNRFHAQGMDMYTIDLLNGNSELTNTGAKLLNWYRESLGLHIDKNINFNIVNNNEKIDFTKLDNLVKSVEPLTKVYTNTKTKMTTMWGWLSDEDAKKYKRIGFLDKNNKIQFSTPIRTENTSNYFYYKNMDNKEKKSLNKGFKQWIMDWSIFGNYSNAELPLGQYKMVFIDENGNIHNPKLSDEKTIKKTNFNNDYPNNLSSLVWSESDKKNIYINVRG